MCLFMFVLEGRQAHVLEMLRHYGGVPNSCFAANLGRAAWTEINGFFQAKNDLVGFFHAVLCVFLLMSAYVMVVINNMVITN